MAVSDPRFQGDLLEANCSCGKTSYVFVTLIKDAVTTCRYCHNQIYLLTCPNCRSGYAFPTGAKELDLIKRQWRCSSCGGFRGRVNPIPVGIEQNKTPSYRRDEIPPAVLEVQQTSKNKQIYLFIAILIVYISISFINNIWVTIAILVITGWWMKKKFKGNETVMKSTNITGQSFNASLFAKLSKLIFGVFLIYMIVLVVAIFLTVTIVQSKQKIVDKYYCSDICNAYSKKYQVYEGINTKEACREIGGEPIFDAAWGGFIGCVPSSSFERIVALFKSKLGLLPKVVKTDNPF